MNKTKRTLIVSSVVMALVLVVTVVSVTAAWFSNVASSKEDKFTIDSTTLQESANITIGDNDIGGSNNFAWPAVLAPGTMLKNGEYPRGKALKKAGGNIVTAAKTAVFYFPINFIGSSDLDSSGNSIDGRRSLMLKVNSAKLADASDGESVGDTTDYKSKFNVEMILVTIAENNGKKTATEISLDNVYSDALSGTDKVYYYQKTVNNTPEGEPCDEFYMLIIPGEEYYVKATIYFNEVDEQYDDLLYLKNKTLKFDFTLTTDMPTDVNIRKHNPKLTNP